MQEKQVPPHVLAAGIALFGPYVKGLNGDGLLSALARAEAVEVASVSRFDVETLTPVESADALGVSERTIRRMIVRGDVPSVRIGPRLVRIPKAALARRLSTMSPAHGTEG